jgi:hypothetical protein
MYSEYISKEHNELCSLEIFKISQWFVEAQVYIFRCVSKIMKSEYHFQHVYPSIHIEQLGSHYTDFHEIWYLGIFWKSIEKVQVSLKIGQE